MEGANNSPKVTLMWSLLSQERQKDMYKLITNVLSNFKKSGNLELGRMYPIEITKAFDKEEPHQFIYLKCIFRFIEVEPSVNSIQMLMEDMEVFKKDSFHNWLDHVNQINKQQESETQIFYENNIFKQENTEKNQVQIDKACEDGTKTMPEALLNDIAKQFAEKNKEKGRDITNESFFDFYEKDTHKLSSNQYVDMFRSFARASLNKTMESFINQNHWEYESCFNNVLNNLKTLQNKFSTCDFWLIKQEQLADMGFINWADKMMLIPFWAFPVILKNSVGKVLNTKGDAEFTVIDDITNIDFSITFGCVPYGIPMKDINQVK